MANPHRGEVEVVVDGVARRARLTLGVLAELEEQLGETSLLALVKRLEGGQVSSRDVLALLVAGLRGAGWEGRREDLLAADIAGGPCRGGAPGGPALGARLRAVRVP